MNGRAARIVLDRPPLNIVTLEMLRQLEAVAERLAAMPEVRVVTLAAAGTRAFSAGVDVADHAGDRAPAMLAAFQSVAERLLDLDQVLVASVRAPALGGGWELVLLCDLVVAADDARFGVPEIALAALPPVAAAVLPRVVGEARARRLVLTGEPLAAAEAYQWGLVSRLVPAADVERVTEELVGQLLAHSGIALRLAKRAMTAAGRGPLRAAIREATELYRSRLLPTADAAEGIAAFLERRQPAWRHA